MLHLPNRCVSFPQDVFPSLAEELLERRKSLIYRSLSTLLGARDPSPNEKSKFTFTDENLSERQSIREKKSMD